jgi:hypothetical protein
MTVGKWDAEAWHRRMAKKHGRPAAPRRRLRPWTFIVAAGMLFATVVSATQFTSGPERIGVCHATGSDVEPYRLLSVNKNGYEHGHHRNHEHDYFVDASATTCDGAAPEPGTFPPTDGGTGGDADGDETDGGGAADGNETAGGDADDDATDDDGSDGNETDDGGVGNETDDGDDETSDGDAGGVDDTDAGDDTGDDTGGETGDDTGGDTGDGTTDGAPNGTGDTGNTSAPQGDAVVRQTAQQDGEQVVLTITVWNQRNVSVHGVEVDEMLPDVRRPWLLVSSDGAQCVLETRVLHCFVGDVGENDTAQVVLRAFTDRMPCGQDAIATARISADDDGEARNNASSAGIAARSC